MTSAIRRLLVVFLPLAFAPCSLHAAKPKPCQIQGLTPEQCAPAATAVSHNLVLYSEKKILVAYSNPFRFDINPLINSTAIAGASIPAGLGVSPSSTAAALSTNQPLKTAGLVDLTLTSGFGLTTSDPCESAAVSTTAGVDTCWQNLQTQESDLVKDIASIRRTINTSIRSVADEQHCYLVKLKNYSQPILTLDQASGLVAFATATRNNITLAAQNPPPTMDSLACYKGDVQSWPSDQADNDITKLTNLQTALTNLKTAPGFSGWATTAGHQDAYNAIVTLIGSLYNEDNGYATRITPPGTSNINIGQTYSDFQTALDSNQTYRDRLVNIAAAAAKMPEHPENALMLYIALNPCAEWYGKGRIDTISLQYSDITTGPNATPPSVSLGTNTCTPLSIASTGVGVTFNSSPVYAFVPSDNTGAPVIGETAVNKASPLYAVLYNVQLRNLGHGAELFVSPGVGLTSSSSTTTGDFLGGLSLSLARRLIFITPALDFGRRDQLAPGFSIGTKQGSLTAVPTQSHWASQFMISISFGIGPS